MGVYYSATRPTVTQRTARFSLAGFEDHDREYRERALDYYRDRENIPKNCQPIEEPSPFGTTYRYEWFEIVTD